MNLHVITTGVVHIFTLGGPVMWVLLLVCFVLWLLIAERLWFLRLSYPAVRDQHLQQWRGLPERTSWRARARRREIVCEVRLSLTAWLSTLRMLIAICPLLGLLGTVTGMINVFEIITLTGGESQALANGIYRATIPTMSGLVISLSGQYFSSRLRHLAHREQQRFADLLVHG